MKITRHTIKLNIFNSLKRVALLSVQALLSSRGPSERTETNQLEKSSFRCWIGVTSYLHAGGKPEYPEKNLRKWIWIGNQIDLKRRNRESNTGSVEPWWNSAPRKYYYATWFPSPSWDFLLPFLCHFFAEALKAQVFFSICVLYIRCE